MSGAISNVKSVYYSAASLSADEEVKVLKGPLWFLGGCISYAVDDTVASGVTYIDLWDWDGVGSNPPSASRLIRIAVAGSVSQPISSIEVPVGSYVKVDDDLYISSDDATTNSQIRATLFYTGGGPA